MFIRSPDVGVVHWGGSGGTSGQDMLPVGQGMGRNQPWTQGYADTSTGAHFVLHDNLWNTNYVFWWPFEGTATQANRVFRFRLEFA